MEDKRQQDLHVDVKDGNRVIRQYLLARIERQLLFRLFEMLSGDGHSERNQPRIPTDSSVLEKVSMQSEPPVDFLQPTLRKGA